MDFPTRRPRILIVGCGDVGLRVAKLLLPRYQLIALCRSEASSAALREQHIMPIAGDLDVAATLWRIGAAAPTILHFAPPPSSGRHDTRTRHLLAAVPRAKQVIYISTTGVYGDCAGAWVDETRATHAQSARAARRVDAEKTLRIWGGSNGRRVCILRVPGIYAADRLPLARLASGLPALRQTDDVFTNHIHADDLARAVVAALQRGAPQRIYNTADDSELKMGDYLDLVSQRFGLAAPIRMTRDEISKKVDATRLSFMQESRRLKSERMHSELGVCLNFPTVQDWLESPGPANAISAARPVP